MIEHLDLVDRLRGQYHLPVNDGAGPLNGSMTFSREFPAPPIQKEAADEIARLRAENERLRAYIASLDGKTIAIRGEGNTFIDDGVIVAADILDEQP